MPISPRDSAPASGHAPGRTTSARSASGAVDGHRLRLSPSYVGKRKGPAVRGPFLSTPSRWASASIPQRQQRRIAAGRRRVDGDRLLGGEARQVVRAAGLGTGARQVLATEGLHADHRADLVAVDVAVADLDARGDLLDRLVD